MRVLIGSLAAPRRSDSRATAALTPSISNMMRPGLTRATQNSGGPLPFPTAPPGRFLRPRPARKRPDPPPPRALHLPRHGAPSSLDLPRGNARGLLRLQPEIAKIERDRARSGAFDAPLVSL